MKVAGMVGIMVNAKAGSNITRKTIFGAEHIVIEGGGSIIGNSVMNGVFYPLEELKSLAEKTPQWIHAPLGHPVDEAGNFVSAQTPQGAAYGYAGLMSGNYRMKDDVLIRDIAINVEIAGKYDGGIELMRRVEAGEDVDTSTGLLYKPSDEMGFGLDGEPYVRVARNMMLDHDAVLLNEEGAATSDQGVGLFVNSSGDKEEVDFKTVAVNASIPAMSLPIYDGEFNQDEAIEGIKKYTNSEGKPSHNYRKFFLEFDRDDADSFEAYRKPFAVIIDGVPHAAKSVIMEEAANIEALEGRHKAAIENYVAKFAMNSDSTDVKRGESYAKMLFNKFISFIANKNDRDYNDPDITAVNNQNEGDEMKELIQNALKEAGVDITNMDDKALMNAYSDLLKGSAKNAEQEEKPAEAQNSKDTEILAAVKALADQVNELKTAQNSNRETELNDLASQVESLDIGLNSASAKLLGADAMKSLIAKHSGDVVFNTNSRYAVNAADSLADLGITLIKQGA